MSNKGTFDQGVIWAAAFLADAHDLPTIAAELLQKSGADLTEVDVADAPAIAKALRHSCVPGLPKRLPRKRPADLETTRIA